MELLIKPSEVKQHVKITNISQHFESNNEVKESSLIKITLTHIETGLTSSSSGYNKTEVMSNCLEKLNKYVVAKKFFDNISVDNTTTDIEEVSATIK